MTEQRTLLDFDDAGAGDDHPAKGVTVGDIRRWYDEREELRSLVRESIPALHRIWALTAGGSEKSAALNRLNTARKMFPTEDRTLQR